MKRLTPLQKHESVIAMLTGFGIALLISWIVIKVVP